MYVCVDIDYAYQYIFISGHQLLIYNYHDGRFNLEIYIIDNIATKLFTYTVMILNINIQNSISIGYIARS